MVATKVQKNVLEDYQKISNGIKSVQLLDKTLATGQISVIEYLSNSIIITVLIIHSWK